MQLSGSENDEIDARQDSMDYDPLETNNDDDRKEIELCVIKVTSEIGTEKEVPVGYVLFNLNESFLFIYFHYQ